MIIRNKRSFSVFPITLASFILQPIVANAQPSNAPALEEITVTVNKRQESMNDVGVTVSAMTGEDIKQRQITNPEEFAATVPGLTLAPSSHDTPIYTLRGVGYNADALAVYPAVSIYLDEAPLPFPVLGARSLFDLERIEVLKGPQGILFGQNSTGGAINYIAAKPTEEFEAGIEFGYGRFEEVSLNGYLSGPVGDVVRGRFAFDMRKSDEWQRSYTRDDELGKKDYWAARIILEADPTENLMLHFNINGSVDKSDPTGKQLIVYNPAFPALAGTVNPDAPNVPLAPRNDNRAADWSVGQLPNWSESAREPKGDRNLLQTFLRADYNLNDSVVLTSLTTYNYLEQDPVTDLDGSALQFTDLPVDKGQIKAFNQELRLSNSNAADGNLRWAAGVNFDTSDVEEDQHITYGDNSLSPANASITGTFNPAFRINNSGIDFVADTEAYAVFGNVEYDVAEDITLRAGARYTDSEFEVDICGYSPGDGNVANLFNFLGELFVGPGLPQIGPDDCYTLNDDLIPGELFEYTLSEDNVSWKVGIDYRVNDDVLVYSNIAKGYKSGSFPAITAATFDALEPATQESVLSYELGFKATMLDNRMQTNAAVFYQDYKDKQIQGAVDTALFGVLQQLINVPESRIYGAEMDITFVPIDGLTITTAVSYLDTKVEEYVGINIVGDLNDDHSGDELPYAPEWTFITDVNYTIPINDGELFMGATANYRTDQDTYIGGSRVELNDIGLLRSTTDKPYVIDGYTTVDARIGWRALEHGLTITAWGKNITDEYYVTNSVAYNEVSYQIVGRPVTYGFTVGYSL